MKHWALTPPLLVEIFLMELLLASADYGLPISHRWKYLPGRKRQVPLYPGLHGVVIRQRCSMLAMLCAMDSTTIPILLRKRPARFLIWWLSVAASVAWEQPTISTKPKRGEVKFSSSRTIR